MGVPETVLALASGLIGLIAAGIATGSARRLRIGTGGIELVFDESRRRIEQAVDRDVESDPSLQQLQLLVERLVTTDTNAATREDVARLSAEVRTLAAQTRTDRRNTALLGEYHSQTLAQSQLAFRVSLVFASLGFVLIAATVFVAIIGGNAAADDGTIISLVGGTIIEAVAGLFFALANQTSTKMAGFFDSARADRSLEEALALADTVPDPAVQSRLKTVLALRLAAAQASDDVVRSIMAEDRPDVDGDSGPR